MQYTKIPVAIEAVRYIGFNCFSEYPDWLIESLEKEVIYTDDDGNLYIKTLEGDMCAPVSSYIIQGVKGELYACEPNIFKMTYEPTLR